MSASWPPGGGAREGPPGSSPADAHSAAPAPAPAVEAEGLSRSFGPVTALDGLSFRVAPGELFGVVGPDGAGKTTLLRILAGVLRPTGGEARVLGIPMSTGAEAAKPRLAYMAQRFGLYEDLTVDENLEFYADLHGVPRGERPRRKERLHAFSGLGEFQGRLAGKLSGGMKQKLSLSCCLVHHPALLLLDEPTFGVDPISRRDLWLILHEMVAEGITVVVSTSYLDEAERCDRVLLLDGGRTLALDTPEALRRSLPGTLLEVEVDRPRDARDLLRGGAGIAGATLFGERLHVLAGEGVESDSMADILSAAGIHVASIRPAEPSLEDVFLHRVEGGPGGRTPVAWGTHLLPGDPGGGGRG